MIFGGFLSSVGVTGVYHTCLFTGVLESELRTLYLYNKKCTDQVILLTSDSLPRKKECKLPCFSTVTSE